MNILVALVSLTLHFLDSLLTCLPPLFLVLFSFTRAPLKSTWLVDRVFEVYPLSELYVCDSVLPVMFSNQSQRTYSSCLKRFLHPLSNPASVNWKQPLWFSFLSLGHFEPSCQEFCQGARWILGGHRRVYSIHGGDGVTLETCAQDAQCLYQIAII